MTLQADKDEHCLVVEEVIICVVIDCGDVVINGKLWFWLV